MGCEQTRVLLHGYLDGELDAARSTEFERHLETCSQCAAQLESEERLRASLKTGLLYENAPPGLALRVSRQIDAAQQRTTLPWPWRVSMVRMAVLAAAALVAGGVASFLVFKMARSTVSAETPLVAEAIDAHIRSLQPGHLTDVASTDQHTVKPWFDGKLDYVPPVKDEGENGFPLVGGRLDALGGHTVAALVYGRRQHFVNVFAWPASDSDPEPRSRGTRNGFQWIYWKSGGMEFCAVSDVSEADLRELVDFLQ